MTKEARMTPSRAHDFMSDPRSKPAIQISCFVILSGFVIRHSSFLWSYGAHTCLRRRFSLSSVNADVVGKDRGQRRRTFATPAQSPALAGTGALQKFPQETFSTGGVHGWLLRPKTGAL